MASRGRGRRGRPRGASQAPPVFDQQAFVEAVGITATAIAQTSTAGSQGGPSNLQRFRAHRPLTFTGGGGRSDGGRPLVHADRESVRGYRDYSDTTRIRLAAFQLDGEAQVWWNWAKTSRDLEAMTWAEF